MCIVGVFCVIVQKLKHMRVGVSWNFVSVPPMSPRGASELEQYRNESVSKMRIDIG